MPHPSQYLSQIRMAWEQQDEPDEDRKNEHPKEYPDVKTSLLYQPPSYKIKLQQSGWLREVEPDRHLHLRRILQSYGTKDSLARPLVFLVPRNRRLSTP